MSVEDVKSNIAKFVGKDASALDDAIELRSLVHDSFVLVELVMQLQEDFVVRIGQEDLVAVKTVGQLCQVITSKQEK